MGSLGQVEGVQMETRQETPAARQWRRRRKDYGRGMTEEHSVSIFPHEKKQDIV